MDKIFTEDDNLHKIVKAYSLDMINFAKKRFKIKLDWTDDSIQFIEQMLGGLHRALPEVKLSNEQIFLFAKTFGSYIGETYRKNHNAVWGMIEIEGKTFPGLMTQKNQMFWPWGKAQNRIINGEEDNVWVYYQALLKAADGNSKQNTTKLNKPWYKKIWGF